jgi:hypothetical protein
MGGEIPTPSSIFHILTRDKGVSPLRSNKPYKGSISLFGIPVNTGKTSKSLFFGSCGKFA